MPVQRQDAEFRLSATVQAPLGAITPAEKRVLLLLSRGDSNRRIAEQLVISPRTVETHVSSLLAKTGCRNRTQLTLWNQGQPRGDR
jgi:DNA-binding NarL/FixJ family response regulator